MKLKKFEIIGLFGEFNYLLNFENIEDNVIILTAPNGYGKSTILKILDELFNKNFDLLIEEPFERFTVEFDNNFIVVEKSEIGLKINYNNIGFSINKNQLPEYNKKFNHIMNNELYYFKKIKSNKWIDERDQEILSTKEIVDRYEFLFTGLNFYEGIHGDFIDNLDENILFVEANRLSVSNQNQDKNNSSINLLSENILELIRGVIKNQYDMSMNQSSDFPERVMSLLSDKSKIKVADVIKKIVEITKFDKTFNENEIFGGLKLDGKIISKLKNEEIYNNESFLMVLNSYLEDMLERIGFCRDLAKRINLFKNSVNSLLQFKNIDIHPHNGLIVTKKNKKTKKDIINYFDQGDFSIDLLSSGEQNLIILLGNLIFNTKNGTLILVDEPEISLHAAWQKRLLELIKEISVINKFNVIIATHSFTLINGNWDNTIELAELKK